MVRIRVHLTALGWEVNDTVRVFLFDSWAQAQHTADGIASRWRANHAGWR